MVSILQKMVDSVHKMADDARVRVQIGEFGSSHSISAGEAIRFGFEYSHKNRARFLFKNDGHVVKFPQRETIMVKAQVDDPVLFDARKKAQDGLDAQRTSQRTLMGKVDFLMNYVKSLMPNDNLEKDIDLVERNLNKAGDHLMLPLGELISAGAGGTHHRSLLFKVLADDAGLECSLKRGYYANPATATFDHHAWNEIIDRTGKPIIVDNMLDTIVSPASPDAKHYLDHNKEGVYNDSELASNLLSQVNTFYSSAPDGSGASLRRIDVNLHGLGDSDRMVLFEHFDNMGAKGVLYNSATPVLRYTGEQNIAIVEQSFQSVVEPINRSGFN